MLSVAFLLLAAPRVLIVPAAGDELLRAATEAAGLAVVGDEEARAALALVDDPSCARGESACLARAAVVAEASLAVALVRSGGVDRVDVVVVSAAGERRRVQSQRASLVEDLARALVPGAARLRWRLEPADALALVDDAAVDGTSIDVLPGEHHLRASAAGHAGSTVVATIEAGETLWLDVTLSALPIERPLVVVAPVIEPPSGSPGFMVAGGGAAVVGVAALVVGGVLAGQANGTIADAEAAGFQSDRVRLAAEANAGITGATVAFAIGGVALIGAVGLLVWGGS
ncbi:MAG: hypothetical protein Q8O67_30605 [Deltaproteobacteria bacterium]|nr:hypothetical protein [Deltaproteobacteria bacterium]